MKAGDTYLIWSPSDQDDRRKHLFFCLNDPCGNFPKIILASCSSYHSKADTSCILHPSDHPFLKHKSFIMYGRCRQESIRHIENMIEHETCRLREPVDMSVVERIINGAKTSDFSPPWLLDLLSKIYG